MTLADSWGVSGMSKYRFIGVVAAAVLSGVAPAHVVDAAQTDNLPPIRCEASDRIDGSSAAQAKRKLNAAGYLHATELKKTCTNYWHGLAVKDGIPTRVSLSPEGLAVPEGD